MTLAELLVEKEEFKTLIKTSLAENPTLNTSYTANGIKLVYEGYTKTYTLLNQVNAEIATIEANIQRNEYR